MGQYIYTGRYNTPIVMAQVTVENPAVHKTNKVDGDGRVYVGTGLSGKNVRVVVEVVEDE